MTLSGVLTDAGTVITQYAVYLGIAVAIPLGIRLMGWIKRAVTR